MKLNTDKADNENQGKSTTPAALKKSSEKNSLQMEDNREVSSSQAELQMMIDHSPSQMMQREKLERTFDTPVQRQGPEEEEELMQGKFKSGLADTVQAKAGGSENKTGLPDDLKSGVEHLSKISMDDVRVHFYSGVPASMHALACTRGSEIYVGPGQQRHLKHEAWHVVQQKRRDVKPTGEAQGVPVNRNPSLEFEADIMGEKASKVGRERRRISTNQKETPQPSLLTTPFQINKSELRSPHDAVNHRYPHADLQKKYAPSVSVASTAHTEGHAFQLVEEGPFNVATAEGIDQIVDAMRGQGWDGDEYQFGEIILQALNFENGIYVGSGEKLRVARFSANLEGVPGRWHTARTEAIIALLNGGPRAVLVAPGEGLVEEAILQEQQLAIMQGLALDPAWNNIPLHLAAWRGNAHYLRGTARPQGEALPGGGQQYFIPWAQAELVLGL